MLMIVVIITPDGFEQLDMLWHAVNNGAAMV